MNTSRRTVLKNAAASSALAGLIATGLRPPQALAAEWNQAAFNARDATGALRAIGAETSASSKDLILKLPDIAENGAVVPIDVISNIPNTSSISILVERNPFPLVASFDFANGALPEVSARLKITTTSLVKALVKADGKVYTAQKEVKVTVGDCGG